MKKIAKTLTSISTGITAFIPVCCTSCSLKANETEVHILHINDIHGQIPGYGDDFYDQAKTWAGAIRLARDTQQIISQYPGSIFLSGGDSNSMGAFANCNEGESMYPVMSAMDIRYSVVGNHAWDYGKHYLEEETFDNWARTDDTEGKYFVTSNVIYGAEYRTKEWISDPSNPGFENDYNLWKQQRVKWADPYKVVNMNCHNVAIIGLTTDGIYYDGKQSELTDIAAVDYISSINYTKKWMMEEKGDDVIKNIDAWILLTHCSAHIKDGKLDPTCDAAANIAAKLDENSNVDAILCGHSHKEVVGTIHNETLNKDIWLGEAGWKGEAFVDTKIIFDDTKSVGNRLKEISMEIKHPSIQSSSWEDAHNELEQLATTTTNEVVKATINEYNKQKETTKEILGVKLGTSKDGLPYSYLGQTRGYQSDTMVDQSGAWSQKSLIGGFNEYFSEQITKGELQKVSIGIISPDSIGGAIPAGDFLARDLYKIFQFENYVTYGVLTYSQLEQLCNYIIAGATSNPTHNYDYPFYYDEAHEQPVYQIPEYKGMPWNPYQWYGFSFSVNPTAGPTTDNNWRCFEYIDNSLKVFDPSNDLCDIEDPSTWKDNSDGYWNNKFIAFTLSNFNFDEATGAFNMCAKFGDYNSLTDLDNPALKNHEFTEIVQRDLVEAYCKSLEGTDITLDLSVAQLKQLFNVVI